MAVTEAIEQQATKECNRCGGEFPISEFRRERRCRTNGRLGLCRACENARKRAYEHNAIDVNEEVDAAPDHRPAVRL